MLAVAFSIGYLWWQIRTAAQEEATEQVPCASQMRSGLVQRIGSADLGLTALPVNETTEDQLGPEPDSNGLEQVGVCRAKVTFAAADLADEAATLWIYAEPGSDPDVATTELTVLITDGESTEVLGEKVIGG
jgi:hypothetical protein